MTSIRRRLIRRIHQRLGRSAFVSVGIASNLLLSSCGPDFHLAQKMTPEVDGNPSQKAPEEKTQTPNSSASRAAWEKLHLEAFLNGGRFDKTPVLGLDKPNKELIIRLPMTRNPYVDDPNFNAEVPDVPGARFGLDILDDSGSALVLRLPLAHVIQGLERLPTSRLPNREPIPTIIGGELPGAVVPLSIEGGIHAQIYLYRGLVGIYVNTPQNPFIRLTLPVRNSTRTRTLGAFATIPASLKYDGGYFVLIRFPDDITEIMADNI